MTQTKKWPVNILRKRGIGTQDVAAAAQPGRDANETLRRRALAEIEHVGDDDRHGEGDVSGVCDYEELSCEESIQQGVETPAVNVRCGREVMGEVLALHRKHVPSRQGTELRSNACTASCSRFRCALNEDGVEVTGMD